MSGFIDAAARHRQHLTSSAKGNEALPRRPPKLGKAEQCRSIQMPSSGMGSVRLFAFQRPCRGAIREPDMTRIAALLATTALVTAARLCRNGGDRKIRN